MDLEQLGVAVVAAFVLMKLTEALLVPLWERLKWDRFYLLYVTVVICGGLAWFTGLNFLPIFAKASLVGRILSCLAMGFGPSFLWDLSDRPEPATVPVVLMVEQPTTAAVESSDAD